MNIEKYKKKKKKEKKGKNQAWGKKKRCKNSKYIWLGKIRFQLEY